jgi:diaminopropionate ammonia-lyase
MQTRSASQTRSVISPVTPGAFPPTQLLELPRLARVANVARVFAKSEGERPLGNFKSLGGMFAAARLLATLVASRGGGNLQPLPALICASDGNRGLAVAAAARMSGTSALIYLPMRICGPRARRLEAQGAELVWVRGTYDDAVDAAAAAAARGKGVLISDTSSDPEDHIVREVMAGYSFIAQECKLQFRDELDCRPTHAFIQAGVGGLAAAMTEGLQGSLDDPARVLVVEPERAACVAAALASGRPERIESDLHTSAEMLSCGIASAPALEILMRYEAASVVVPETDLRNALTVLRDGGGPATTVTGAAGLAGLLHVARRPELRRAHGLSASSRVLLVITEGPLSE